MIKVIIFQACNLMRFKTSNELKGLTDEKEVL